MFQNVRRLCVHIVGNVKLLPDNRLDSVRSQHGYESVRAVHVAVVGDCYGVHTPCLQRLAKRMRFYGLFGVVGIGRNLQKSHRTVKQTVFRV